MAIYIRHIKNMGLYGKVILLSQHGPAIKKKLDSMEWDKLGHNCRMENIFKKIVLSNFTPYYGRLKNKYICFSAIKFINFVTRLLVIACRFTYIYFLHKSKIMKLWAKNLRKTGYL